MRPLHCNKVLANPHCMCYPLRMASAIPNATSAGELVRQLREERGLTQAELAIQSGIDPATVSNIERGHRRISPRAAILLSRWSGLPVDRFWEA